MSTAEQRVNERCERTSEWPSTQRVDFIVIQLKARRKKEGQVNHGAKFAKGMKAFEKKENIGTRWKSKRTATMLVNVRETSNRLVTTIHYLYLYLYLYIESYQLHHRGDIKY